MKREYWRAVHRAVADDLAAVNYPALPVSFNRLVDRLFERPLLEALRGLTPGRAVEVGCGRGRWLRRLERLGWKTVGMDIAPAARPGVVGGGEAMPFRDAAFDLVLAVTVLQHLEEKDRVLGEAARLVRPGGHLLLVELIDRPGVTWQEHVRPWSVARWRAALAARGLESVEERPVEHLPLLRLIERVRSMRPRNAPSRELPGAPPRSSRLKNLFWQAVTVSSTVLEPAARRLAPESASHRLFLLRRPSFGCQAATLQLS